MKRYQLLKSLFTFCFLLCFLLGFSQNKACGFDPIHKQLLQQNEIYRRTIAQNEKRVQERMMMPGWKAQATVYKIPVVVHVIHNGEAVGTGTNISDAQIQSAISAMSQHYRGTLGNSVDVEIEFELAKLDVNCNPVTGIVRVNGSAVPNYATSGLTTGGGGNELAVKNLSRWPSQLYYNIWIVSEINNNNGGAGVQGFAYFPGAPADRDGAVVLFNAFGYDPTELLGYNLKTYTNRNTVITHEMGHALGLYHTFEGDDSNNDGVADTCPANASCTSEGDMVCDTDPHQRSMSNCPAGANACNSGLPLGTIVNNYMDYSSETCQDRFTAGQVSRMRAFLETVRPGLTTSLAASATYPYGSFSDPLAASCTPVTDPLGLSGAYTGIMNVQINGRNFSSFDTYSDGGYVDGTSCLNVVQLAPGANYSISVTVMADPNWEQARAWIDYNNDGVFDNATEQIFYADNIVNEPGGYVTVTGNFTVPPTATTNTNIRIRIIGELATAYDPSFAITGACYNPVYGQAEDYVARISGVLPLTLEDFSGTMRGNEALLSWKTSQETGTKEFEVQRSADGDPFTTIGVVRAAGNSTGTRSYSFTDDKPGRVNHYRLNMIDLDGRSRLSPVVILRKDHPGQDVWVNNPFDHLIQIRFAKQPGQTRVQLVNAMGAVVAEKSFSTGDESINWHLSAAIAPGNYVIKITTQTGEVFTRKLLKR